ncbi:MAG TPA: hypothetical protein VHI93_09525 [Candidatus Thermoplasmatota archaeon]|nr:hypothetical protein [Candidatus Thermoplasmatota archaeon]
MSIGVLRARLRTAAASFAAAGPDAEAAAQEWLALQAGGATSSPVHCCLLLEDGTLAEADLDAKALGPVPRLRRSLSLHHFVRSHTVTLKAAERQESRRVVEALLGPALRLLSRRQEEAVSRPTLHACPCGRRVPWRRAWLAGRPVHVLAMHATVESPGRPCPVVARLYRDLDPVAPAVLGAGPPPVRPGRTWWEQVLLGVPRHLGGPLREARRKVPVSPRR